MLATATQIISILVISQTPMHFSGAQSRTLLHSLGAVRSFKQEPSTRDRKHSSHWTPCLLIVLSSPIVSLLVVLSRLRIAAGRYGKRRGARQGSGNDIWGATRLIRTLQWE